MSTRITVRIEARAPGTASVFLVQNGQTTHYADAKRTGHDGRWWGCRDASTQTEYSGRSRKAAIRVWLSSLGVNADTAEFDASHSY